MSWAGVIGHLKGIWAEGMPVARSVASNAMNVAKTYRKHMGMGQLASGVGAGWKSDNFMGAARAAKRWAWNGTPTQRLTRMATIGGVAAAGGIAAMSGGDRRRR